MTVPPALMSVLCQLAEFCVTTTVVAAAAVAPIASTTIPMSASAPNGRCRKSFRMYPPVPQAAAGLPRPVSPLRQPAAAAETYAISLGGCLGCRAADDRVLLL